MRHELVPRWSAPAIYLSILRNLLRPGDAGWLLGHRLVEQVGGGRWRGGSRRLRLRHPRARRSIEVLVDRQVGGLGSYYEIFDEEVYCRRADFVPQRGWLVVDIGANIGIFSMFCGHLVGEAGRIVAVEPVPETHRVLLANLDGLPAEVHCVEVACGAERGRAQVVFHPGRSTTASIATGDADGAAERRDVEVRTLDQVTDDAVGGADIDLLKIDVEGTEVGVLEGGVGVLARVSRVVVEADAATSAAVSEVLLRAGLHPVHRVSDVWTAGNDVLYFRR